MSTSEAGSDFISPAVSTPNTNRVGARKGLLAQTLAFFSSLRLTVTLLAMCVFLVLAGTLAQIDHDVWHVVWKMFRAWWTWIDLQLFFPRSWQVPGGFPYPGGWLLGTLLAVNLLTAHAFRFKVTGRGQPLWLGWGLIVAGTLITYLVIQSGLDETVESELSASFCDGLWHALRASLGMAALALCYGLALSAKQSRQVASGWLWWLAAIVAALIVVLVVWLFVHPEIRLDPSGLRILWQLIKGGAAGLVLLAGCQLVFGPRGGIALLHTGIGLLMFSELHTGLTAEEAMMTIAEGQTVNYAEDMRSVELALVDRSPEGHDQVTVIPAHLLDSAAQTEMILETDELPVALRLIEYFPNSRTRILQPGEKGLATHGIGRLRRAKSIPTSKGVATNQAVDVPSAYVEVLTKQDHQSLGTYLLSPQLDPEWVAEPDSSMESVSSMDSGKPLEIALRFKRLPKRYSIHLTDFRFDRYVGTDTPKNYSSLIRLIDPANRVDRSINIWMNNPLRYGGDTLYQADWDHETERGTVLQVVTNTGWMIPYVACMLVATGMLAHFSLVLMRFVRRRADEMRRLKVQVETDTDAASGWLVGWQSPAMWIPALVVLALAGWVLSRARPTVLPSTAMQIGQFGKLPIAYQARVKPYDTLARNSLRILSGKQTFVDKQGKRQPAIRWLLDILADTAASREHQILRIDNLDVLEALGLQRRKGFRYSLSQLFGKEENREQYLRQVQLASEVPEADRTLVQQRFLALARNVSLMTVLRDAFASPALQASTKQDMQQELLLLKTTIDRLNQSAPRAIPPREAGGPWKTLLEAEFEALIDQMRNQPVNPSTTSLRTILNAYAAQEEEEFNTTVAAYFDTFKALAKADQQYDVELAKDPEQGRASLRKEAEKLNLPRIQFEAFFNHFNPFLLAMVLYLTAFLLSACSWLGWSVALNRTAGWLLWLTVALHTFALIARIYISGRPPVTNLYSSAVFIGWASVLFALGYERISRFGVGNLLASAIGFPTLLIAYQLAGDGDTFRVLQAVLDTQFWLATHVVCITLGYSTTLLAGALGILYLIAVHWLDCFDTSERAQLMKMTYGTLCFAIFFSFVGTVLGGLWADDSWGRFWGWDPKENGALIIVLWNALVLHARWGRMAGPRGLAMLAVAGNIVTTWSWFGVNELGVGLHSYGFSNGTTFWLMMFVLSQLVILALGLLPPKKQAAV
jgi:ABC-type transport system involved in cytochrome c biogenesis permease subunit